MTKKEAKDLLMAHSCCLFSNTNNNLCELCPWINTENCDYIIIDEQIILKAVSVLRGFSITKMKLDEIKITKAFSESNPSKEKLDECRKYWNTFHKQDRFVEVDNNGYLHNGYCMYLVLKENGIEEVNVKVITKQKQKHKKNKCVEMSNKPTTYIYGYHPKAEIKKEYVWRIPNTDKWDWYRNNVRVGDKIVCRTKFGNQEVVVTKIDVLDNHPVDGIIKNVANTEIMRGGYNVVQ